jgi:uncharacterized protein (TIGR00255 family)
MRSMTGHGRGTGEAAGRRVTVEIRAVNHRFFDLKWKTGAVDARVEEAAAQAVRRRVERGALTLALREDSAGPRSGAFRVDLELARAVKDALEEARKTLGLADPVALDLVLAQPGVVTAGDPADSEALLSALGPALDAALAALVAMRRREGEALARDLGSRLDRVETLADEIASLAVDVPATLAQRFKERVDKLLATVGMTIDETRLATEIAVFADRTDTTEEIVRLRAHIAAMRSHVREDAAVGRRLDFLVQELGREVNTIGSKSQSSEIARRVVEAKAELEKIREQVQNIE